MNEELLKTMERDVREFMLAITERTGRWYPHPDAGPMPDSIRLARMNMFASEMDELFRAHSSVDVADGYIDMAYVAMGGLIEGDEGWKSMIDATWQGFRRFVYHNGLLEQACPRVWSSLWTEVHAANMRKFDGGHYDEVNQKWKKPADWVGPDIAGVLKRYGIQ